ncbi:hypothetical protein [Nocardia sp. alder85J]|uniref:hypothetical protein n=1 Tax=Nocardia sp. alder85J TaxID=2862949 RepID=UPI001CD23700|nr:hypothetical protein [Nocardia sp. alder85J]MCX4092682.1 hypothetical protein [Nocardia sp. alder85J]
MAAGKHRAPNPHRNRVGTVVAAGAVPLVLAVVGAGTANAAAGTLPIAQQEDAPQWPAADSPNEQPYEGMHIPHNELSSLQTARALPNHHYLAPIGTLHTPVSVAPVPPIAPPPGKFRFGDVQVDAPEWINRDQAIMVNDTSAQAEAGIATFLDSIGMERSRSDRIAGQTVGTAAMGAVVGASAATPLTLSAAAMGGLCGLIAGVPFLPIGLVAGPLLGAAVGAAVITIPAAALGAGVGAAVGAVGGLTAPSRVLGDI